MKTRRGERVLPLKKVTVLLVEDNVVDIQAVRRMFHGHRIANPVVVAHDGIEALEMLRGEHSVEISRPFLILLDLNMPRMNGIEFLSELRKDRNLRSSIVFVLTTSDSDQDKLESYEFNIAGYIVKRAVGEGFINLVTMLGHYWRIVEFPVQKDA